MTHILQIVVCLIRFDDWFIFMTLEFRKGYLLKDSAKWPTNNFSKLEGEGGGVCDADDYATFC